MYRIQYNVPRVPVDKTDDLTEYEFEYEFLLKNAYHEWIKSAVNNDPIEMRDGQLNRQYLMDEETYETIANLANSEEIIDFGIPEDAPSGNKLSEKLLGVSKEDDLVPVNMEELFGE